MSSLTFWEIGPVESDICPLCNTEINWDLEPSTSGFWAVTKGTGMARARPAHLACIRAHNRESYGQDLERAIFENARRVLENR